MDQPNYHLRICNCAGRIGFLDHSVWKGARFHLCIRQNGFLEVVAIPAWFPIPVAFGIFQLHVVNQQFFRNLSGSVEWHLLLSQHFVKSFGSIPCTFCKVVAPSQMYRSKHHIVFHIPDGNAAISRLCWASKASIGNPCSIVRTRIGQEPGWYAADRCHLIRLEEPRLLPFFEMAICFDFGFFQRMLLVDF